MPADQPVNAATFETSLRLAWGRVNALLEAAGSDTNHLIEITSYHVLTSPLLDKASHNASFRRIKDEFVKKPYPAWTAVGVAEMFAERGLVEFRVVARKRD